MVPRKKTKAIQKIERFRERAIFWRSSPKPTPDPHINVVVRQFNAE